MKLGGGIWAHQLAATTRELIVGELNSRWNQCNGQSICDCTPAAATAATNSKSVLLFPGLACQLAGRDSLLCHLGTAHFNSPRRRRRLSSSGPRKRGKLSASTLTASFSSSLSGYRRGWPVRLIFGPRKIAATVQTSVTSLHFTYPRKRKGRQFGQATNGCFIFSF